MADWVTNCSSLATAGGTLVLAVATFASIRSANRSARIAERALQIGLRPVLFPSHPEDSSQRIRWSGDYLALLPGAGAIATVDPGPSGNVYLAMSVRNVGAGIAVLRGWRLDFEFSLPIQVPDPDTFRPQTRDLYVPAGDVGFWQGAIRSADDPERAACVEAIEAGRAFSVVLLHSDHEGGQPTASRFVLAPVPDDEVSAGPEGGPRPWECSVVRHWNLEG